MKLYLVRHGDAAPLGEGGVTEDADRPLTETGRKQAQALSAALQKHDVRLGLVLTSPLRRAQETAQTLLDGWAPPVPELRECEYLAFDGKRRKLAKFVEELGSDSVALVGHQPDLGDFAAWLIGSRKVQIELAKGGCAHILSDDEIAKGSGALLWMLTPEWVE
jgi:phosphohistidine phosphatase